VPTGSVPDDRQNAFTLGCGDLQQALEHQNDVIGVRLALTKEQEAFSRVLAHRPEAGDGFVWLAKGGLPFDQSQRLTGGGPAMQSRLGKTTEPAFILVE
jgi:hypothetical protein